MPSPEARGRLARRDSESFRFTLKPPQRITHVDKLAASASCSSVFSKRHRSSAHGYGAAVSARVAAIRGGRLDDSWRRFPGRRFSVSRWSFDTRAGRREVKAKLAAKNVEWCDVDGEDREPAIEATGAGFPTISATTPRLREALRGAWAYQLRPTPRRPGADVYLYFKHEDDHERRYIRAALVESLRADVGSPCHEMGFRRVEDNAISIARSSRRAPAVASGSRHARSPVVSSGAYEGASKDSEAVSAAPGCGVLVGCRRGGVDSAVERGRGRARLLADWRRCTRSRARRVSHRGLECDSDRQGRSTSPLGACRVAWALSCSPTVQPSRRKLSCARAMRLSARGEDRC